MVEEEDGPRVRPGSEGEDWETFERNQFDWAFANMIPENSQICPLLFGPNACHYTGGGKTAFEHTHCTVVKYDAMVNISELANIIAGMGVLWRCDGD